MEIFKTLRTQNKALTSVNNDVIEIRWLYSRGRHTQRKLAKMYGVAQGTIKDIVNRNTWKHVK